MIVLLREVPGDRDKQPKTLKKQTNSNQIDSKQNKIVTKLR